MDDFNSTFTQTRESLDFALESGKMATWEFNLETNEVTCSKEMLRLWGVEPQEFNNNRLILQSKVHPEDLEEMRSRIQTAITNRSVYEFEYRILPRLGEIRWVRSRGRCTFSTEPGSFDRFAGIVYDITEQKLKEFELANAIKARSDFLSVAGHELKTPLTCMQLHLQVMESQLQDFPTKSGAIEDIAIGLKKQQDYLQRISMIVDNILDEAKISEGLLSLNLESCDLVKLTFQVVEQVKLVAATNLIEIRFLSFDEIIGRWDRFRIEQVLLNLLMNAIRHSNRKPVTVEVRKVMDNALITVKDQGIGIRLEDQSKIFQRFVRITPDIGSSGMGLGLFISNHIVEAHGGEMRVKSQLGEGCEFTVSLPLGPS